MLVARQIMDARVPRVRFDEPRESCLKLLGPHRQLVVLDGGGGLAGLLSHRHLVRSARSRRAGDLAAPAATVDELEPAPRVLNLLVDEDGVVVMGPDGRPAGLVSVEDAVQMARFVLPPDWTVGDVMQSWVPAPAASGPTLHIAQEARLGADTLADAGSPIVVVGPDGTRVGSLANLDIVRALQRWMAAHPYGATV